MKKDSKQSREAVVCVSYIKRYYNSSGLSAIVMKPSVCNDTIPQHEIVGEFCWAESLLDGCVLRMWKYRKGEILVLLNVESKQTGSPYGFSKYLPFPVSSLLFITALHSRVYWVFKCMLLTLFTCPYFCTVLSAAIFKDITLFILFAFSVYTSIEKNKENSALLLQLRSSDKRACCLFNKMELDLYP